MTRIDWLLDATVASALPLVAWTVTRSVSMSRGVVLFIAFGMLSALAWARLSAVDVALVEASIGAGLSGALFMTSLRWAEASRVGPGRSFRSEASALLVTLAIALSLGPFVLGLPPQSAGLVRDVTANLEAAGVRQPVTAVLLNFRAYDTLLEIYVLVASAIAVSAVRTARPEKPVAPELLAALAGALLPLCILLAGYFLWRGSHAPGGAFQAGAVLAGGAVVAMLAGRMRPPRLASPWNRALLMLGPLVFIAVAAVRSLAGGSLLEHSREHAAETIFGIELASAITIALVLATFFPGVGAFERLTIATGRRTRDVP